jgi:DNA-binding beta-propeller fold protein YncE
MKQVAKHNLYIFLGAILALLLMAGVSIAEEEVSASYLYTLSNFSGILPVSWVSISIDELRNEVYVVPGKAIKIFNDKGMEVYSFNDAGDIEGVMGVAVDDKGDIFVLSSAQNEIIHCNYRGERIAKMELKNLPKEFAGFSPNRIFFRKGLFYLASARSMQVIATDHEGIFKEGYDIAALIRLDGNLNLRDSDSDIVSLSVDQEGNILFTMPLIAKVGVLTPDKKLYFFGRAGSTPGRFGVIGGVASDATGKFVLVADTLRCVVMVFDRNFKFYTEFGFRGLGPSNLVGPMELAVDSKNRVYVAQLRQRGVSVFQLAVP